MVHIASLHVYPVKSCRGTDLDVARVTRTGFEHDREWMITSPAGRFLTQREEPRLALIHPRLTPDALELGGPDGSSVQVALAASGDPVEVVVWRDRCAAYDQGDAVADWLTWQLGKPLRLVRFDPRRPRQSGESVHGEEPGYAQFSDGYAMLVLSVASLADLNSRLPAPLPMNRFRPNVVLDGVPAHGEDQIRQLVAGAVRLRLDKACTRCVITTTNQQTAVVEGDEPLRTLRTYRWDKVLRGVAFGQNASVIAGEGESLRVGAELVVA